MANIYLAARYSRHPEMQGYAALLEEAGHVVTSRWILGDHDFRSGNKSNERMWMQRWAIEDLLDLDDSTVAIFFTEGENPPGRVRGGRHVEYGYALAKDKQILVVGPRENVFHYLLSPDRLCETFSEAMDKVGRI